MNPDQAPPTALPAVDMHVHIVGTGAGGTGCWLGLDGLYRRWQARLLLSAIGMHPRDLDGDFDRLYVEHLLERLRESSLGAAVILAQERVHDPQGKPVPGAGLFHVPNDYVLALARRHPEFLPAVSIHPARPDALEELDRCIAGGAMMMKLLPNVQHVDCSDRRFTRFWERMAAAGLPLLSHTGGEKTLPVVDASLANPRHLERPLEVGVTVIAAHCGTKSALFDPQWFPDFVEMTRRHPNLYGDTSAFSVLNNRIRGRVVPETQSEPLASRILHGSDWPVPVSAFWARAKGLIDAANHTAWARHPNLLERDYQLKRAMGYAPECFTRVWSLLPPRKGMATASVR
ncbi:MAG: amidohydrolase family protein [Verrucomicrobia bacterium]|nr:MAG: amidohydrolase family protein [Verrucomicrobiota bacterium]